MPEPGLCGDCAHAKRIANDRGSVFWMCSRSVGDPAYVKYPQLPMLRCAGHEPGAEG